jgi:hypothetical protein
MWVFLKVLFSTTLALALVAKLWEILNHIIVAILSVARTQPGEQGAQRERLRMFPLRIWPVTSRLRKLPFPASRIVQRLLFRYRTLMLTEAAVAAFSTHPLIVIPSALVLFAGLWLEIFRILIDRLTFGHKDDFFRGSLGTVLPFSTGSHRELLSMTRQARLHNFVRLFSQLVALATVAYAAMYCALDTTFGDAGAFVNVPHTPEKFLHLLYFSIVTIATVGYGDIIPRVDCLPARMLTASEIIAGFAMLVLLVTCVSLTFSDEEGYEPKKTP